jgi:hypothetical protein
MQPVGMLVQLGALLPLQLFSAPQQSAEVATVAEAVAARQRWQPQPRGRRQPNPVAMLACLTPAEAPLG